MRAEVRGKVKDVAIYSGVTGCEVGFIVHKLTTSQPMWSVGLSIVLFSLFLYFAIHSYRDLEGMV